MKNIRRGILIWAVLFSACLAAGNMRRASAQALNLRPKFTAGQSAKYLMTLEMVLDSKISGMPQSPGMPDSMQMNMLISFGFTQSVATVSAKEVKVKVKYDSVKMRMSMPGMMSLDYDSSDPADKNKASDPGYAVFAALVGASFEILMTPEGKVTKVLGLDKLVETALSRLGEKYRDVARSQMRQFVDGMEQQLVHSYDFMPSKPVNKGETWTSSSSVSLPMLGDIKTRVTYKYAGTRKILGRDCAEILMTLDNSVGNLNNQGLPSGARILSLEIPSSAGTVWFDPAGGQMIKTESNMNIKMKLGFDHPADSALENASMAQNIAVKTSISMVK